MVWFNRQSFFSLNLAWTTLYYQSKIDKWPNALVGHSTFVRKTVRKYKTGCFSYRSILSPNLVLTYMNIKKDSKTLNSFGQFYKYFRSVFRRSQNYFCIHIKYLLSLTSTFRYLTYKIRKVSL
jgi:hypothetical protein